jgi:GTP-binding protein EngB required for normal cell division
MNMPQTPGVTVTVPGPDFPEWPARSSGRRARDLSPREKLDNAVKEIEERLSKFNYALVPDCPKFRILIIGKQTHGKSTLLEYVLNLPKRETSDSIEERLFGERTPIHRIWIPQESESNKNLILHDSGGFNVGGEETINEVKKFICQMKSKPLPDQIHCIWYCIDSSAAAPIDPIDERFFQGEFETGQIPIFVIFTKYDKLFEIVRKAYNKSEVDVEVEKKAFERFQGLQAQILKASNNDLKIKICRTAIDEGKEKLQRLFIDRGKFVCYQNYKHELSYNRTIRDKKIDNSSGTSIAQPGFEDSMGCNAADRS